MKNSLTLTKIENDSDYVINTYAITTYRDYDFKATLVEMKVEEIEFESYYSWILVHGRAFGYVASEFNLQNADEDELDIFEGTLVDAILDTIIYG